MAVTVIVGGDIVPAFGNLPGFCEGNKDAIIDDACLALLQAADLRIYNLETPITDAPAPIAKDGANFAVPETAVQGLKQLLPDGVCLANNHCLDQGEAGLLTTVSVLTEAGITPIGYGKGKHPQTVSYFEKNGHRIAVVACAETEFTVSGADTYGAVPYHDYWTNKCIAEAKENSELVIVLYHGGKEYYPYVAPYQKDRCHLMVDAGADVVLCQHSHCICCSEDYNGATILYGQGNFIFRQRNNKKVTKEGLLARITYDAGKVRTQFIPVCLDENDKVALADAENSDRILRQLEERSEAIQDDARLRQLYRDHAARSTEGYLARLEKKTGITGLVNRLDRKLFHGKHTQQELLQMLNILQNEAHRELFIAGLKARLGAAEEENR